MIRIVLAEDQEMLLGAIGSLLNLEDDMEVVGLASNGEEALMFVNQLQPDICIMDIEMPEMTGMEAAEALKESECKVMMLTTFARTGYFQRVLSAGVSGYLLKDSPSEELVGAIRSIVAGKEIFSPDLMDVESSANIQEIDPIGLVAEGDGALPKEALDSQGKTIGTVKKYITSVMDSMKLPAG